MANSLEGQIQKEISERHINFIKYNNFNKNQKLIGEGGFGIVREALWEECELPVALKMLKGDLKPTDINVNDKDIREFVKE
ncbi:7647_t:CDS:1, partial [Scutellospora calospora]